MATTIQQIELPKKARAVDTSGNNNHGQIYSGRGLEFDGVGDNLDIGAATIFSTGAWTAAFWVNIDAIGEQQTFLSTSTGTATQNISIKTSGQIGIYAWTGGSGWQEFNTKPKANTWYRVIFVYDGSTNLTFYLNGVADGTGDLVTSYDSLDIRYIGANTGDSEFFAGKMSDVQLWDAAWTAADVTYDYLNPESLALNGGGTALTESNLKLWYPMQDGHRGQQSYILDGANTGLGTELSPPASDITQWSTVSEATQSGTSFIMPSGGYIFENISITSGTGKWVIEGSGDVRYRSNTADAYVTVTLPATVYPAFGSTNARIQLVNSSGSDVTISNISVKAINDKHHATTVFYGDELIPHTNDRTFAGASNWANAAGDNAFANYDETGSGQLTVTPDDVSDVQYAFLDGAIGDDWEADMVAGRTYRLTYDIHVSAFTKGTLSVGLSTDAVPAVMKAKTDYTATNGTGATATLDFVYVAADHEMITIYAAANTVLTADFDNFSLKEVGVASGWTDADQQLHIPQTALQSYNELAWSDGNANVKVEVASLAADLGSSDFSISHVLSPNNITGNNTYLAFNVGSSDGRVIHRIDDEVVEIYIEDSNANTASYEAGSGAGAIKAGQTYHIVEVFDRAADLVTVYINGVASGTTIDISSLNGDIDCNGALGFYNFSSGPAIEGFITEVALWKNTKLDATEVLELYNDGKPLDALTHTKASTLYGYWRNNGLSTWVNLANPGTKDSTTNTLTETILIPQGVDSTRDAQGFIMNRQKSTSCFNNTASGGYIEIPVAAVDDDLAFLGVGDGFSVQVWVKVNGDSNGALILSRNNNTDGYRLEYNTSEKISFGIEENGTLTTAATDSAISADTWYHIVGTFDGDPDNDGSGEIKLYLNGDTDGSATNNTTVSNDMDTSISPMRIGKHYWSEAELFDGAIDGVLIYNKVLSLEEVQRNYKATKGNHRN
jgi:hypothetical protein